MGSYRIKTGQTTMITTTTASEWFWSPKIWLPPNVTWETFDQIEEVDDVHQFARFSDLIYPLPICVIMLMLRATVERYIFKPLGLKLGLKEQKNRVAEENPVLERAYKTKGKISEKEVDALAFETQLTPLQVERWLRLRRRSSVPSKLQKFQETGWRWLSLLFLPYFYFEATYFHLS